MNSQQTLVIFALIAALGVLSVQVVDPVKLLEAEAAGCTSGAAARTAFNAGKGKCFKG